jgi:hypothetical protein
MAQAALAGIDPIQLSAMDPLDVSFFMEISYRANELLEERSEALAQMIINKLAISLGGGE